MRPAAFVFGVIAVAAFAAAAQPVPGPEETVQDRPAAPKQEEPLPLQQEESPPQQEKPPLPEPPQQEVPPLPEPPPQEKSPPAAQQPHRAPINEVLLDQPHDYLSRRMEEYSRRLDNFFSDPNRAYDSTGSTLQIRSHVTFYKGGFTESKEADVRASISLPNTENRLKLIVQRGLEAGTETAAERDIKNTTGSNAVAAPGAPPQDNSYYLGLKALAQEALGATFSVEGGVKFGRPPDPYARLRIFRDFLLSQWVIRVSETPLWKRSEASSAASEVGAFRPLSEEWQLRLTSKATWRSTTSYFDLAQIASLYLTPDKRTVYTFELGAFGTSDRSQRQSVYSATVRARRQIYRDWLYVEVTPQILYPESNGFRPTPSLLLQLETLFGDRYLQP